MRPEPRVPIEINSGKLEEGFYREDNRIFYLSRKNGKWYVQYYFNNVPHLTQESWPTIFADKVTSDELLKDLRKKIEFVESKLEEITKKHPA